MTPEIAANGAYARALQVCWSLGYSSGGEDVYSFGKGLLIDVISIQTFEKVNAATELTKRLSLYL